MVGEKQKEARTQPKRQQNTAEAPSRQLQTGHQQKSVKTQLTCDLVGPKSQCRNKWKVVSD